MPIDEETLQTGVAAISVATTEILEDMHPLALDLTCLGPDARDRRIAALKRVGEDIALLAEATANLRKRKAHFLANRCQWRG